MAFGGLVVGTGNKTESLIGYTTLFGDNACAFNPIGDLYKSQVRQLAAAIGVPRAVIAKAPSADLWPNQTDEGEGSFSYPLLDRILYWRIDRRRSTDELVAMGFERALVERVERLVATVGVQAPGAARRQARTAHGRRRLPVPAAAPGLGALLSGVPVKGAAPVAAPGATLYVVATPIGNLGDVTLRALEVLRAVPLIAAEDTRLSRRLLARYEIETRAISFHARSGPARLAELLAHLRGGADLALVTDAGTPAVSDPGAELVAAWAGEGGVVVPIPGASAVLAAVAASAIAGPRWGFEGFLPRSGRERRSGWRPSGRGRAGDRIVRGADAARGHAARSRRGVWRGPTRGGLPRAHEAPRADRPRHARRARRGGWRRLDPGARRVRAGGAGRGRRKGTGSRGGETGARVATERGGGWVARWRDGVTRPRGRTS